MPNYDYKCTHKDCLYHEEKNIPIDDRDVPIKEPCPFCGNTTIERIFDSPRITWGFRGSTIQSHTPGVFQDHLKEIKKKAGPRATGIEL